MYDILISDVCTTWVSQCEIQETVGVFGVSRCLVFHKESEWVSPLVRIVLTILNSFTVRNIPMTLVILTLLNCLRIFIAMSHNVAIAFLALAITIHFS